jgi:hypothetical protein
MSNDWNTGGSGTADWLLGAVRKNPEGLLLLAAGCALLLRNSRSTARTQRSSTYPYSGEYQRQQRQSGGSNWSEGVSRVADDAREYASSVGNTVKETAGNYASAVSNYAQDTGQKVFEQSRRVADQAQTSMQNLVQQQPLTVAIGGLVAGAAIATAFPTTTWERRALGPAGQRLSEAAETAREKVSEAASAAGERLKSAAQERGLTAEGMKEMAREVAGAIGGQQKNQSASETSRSAAATPGPQPGTGATSNTSISSGTLPGGTHSGTSSFGTTEPKRG